MVKFSIDDLDLFSSLYISTRHGQSGRDNLVMASEEVSGRASLWVGRAQARCGGKGMSGVVCWGGQKGCETGCSTEETGIARKSKIAWKGISTRWR